MSIKNRKERRLKRRWRIRKDIHGTVVKPRLAVYKSNTATYAQLIDDDLGHTLLAASSKTIQGQAASKPVDKARQIGQSLAKQAIEKGITQIVFDRSGYPYHGRVQALAEGAREAGLKF